MSSDEQEFVELVKNFTEVVSSVRKSGPDLPNPYSHDEDEKALGQSEQYSLYKDGYTPMTKTITKLPAGCYNINQDDRCIYASFFPPPSGLLLELPEMKSEKLLKTIETFWDSEKDYKEGNEFVIGGALYRAGSLLFGPGGSGKSKTIQLAAKKMIERNGVVFYASIHPEAVTKFLMEFSKIEPNRKCVVVLEDLDTLIDNYGENNYLEMLDSAKTIDNVFFIATTNYPEKLDARIYNRPGRFSHVIKIGLPSKVTREAYLKAILKNHKDIPYIVENSEGFTVDHLQSLTAAVYREKKDLELEIKRLRTLFSVPKVNDSGLGFGLSNEEIK